MTTFTRIGEEDTPSIDIDVKRRLSKINKNIYGGFMEYVWISSTSNALFRLNYLVPSQSVAV